MGLSLGRSDKRSATRGGEIKEVKNMKIRLLLAQEDEKTLDELTAYFSSSPDYELVGTTRNGREAVALFERFRPDAFVLGVLLPSCDGVTVLETVRLGSCAVIATGAITEKRFASLALGAGAGYYMTEPFEPAVLDRRIKALRSEKPLPSYLDPSHVAAEQRISEIFMTVGIPAHIKGYQFLREAIKMAIDSPEIINSITKRLYPEVAERFSTSPSKVERAIRHAIEVAWNKGKIENINSLFGVKIYSANEKPTNGEFIALVADKMLLESM